MGSAVITSSRATFDPSWNSGTKQTKVEMRTNLTEEQFIISEWEGLKRRYATLRCLWQRNIQLNKQRLNTVKREDVLVSLVRKLQGFGEVLNENRAETWRQIEAQDAAAREQKEAHVTAQINIAQINMLQLQVQVQERETKRQKVRDEKKESEGISVKQLEFNRGKRDNAAKLEKHPDVYYHGPHCSNEIHPEDLEHHAGEIAYTWYHWVTNELICPVDACLPPVMTCISVTDAHHAKLMRDMRHTSEQTFCHTTQGIPCCNKYTTKVNGYRGTIEEHLGETRAHWSLCKLLMDELIELSSGKLTWAVNPGAEQGGWHQAQVTYLIHRVADEINGGPP